MLGIEERRQILDEKRFELEKKRFDREERWIEIEKDRLALEKWRQRYKIRKLMLDRRMSTFGQIFNFI